ncbi:hypothetical protein GCM10011506_08240 [Marivirga lumbricoides]|uniref:Uncharacterized protein n=1 Tax=Marivirga lumbricoides TaxID=1046115 RepID=A0ABQ1LME7_9BACT|nr:hypothetical protein GCM10011506_08240 [Marivirga lumbricoides]
MSTETTTEQIKQKKYNWPEPEDYTPLSFIEEVRIRDGEHGDTLFRVLTMIDKFSNDWVKRNDIDTLMNLIQSTEKCACFLNPLSSYIPIDDYAEIGGFARLFIQSYKENQPIDLGLYLCPKVDKLKNEELTQWWRK